MPRDLTGRELARLLSRFGYVVSRQTGSHMRLISVQRGREHHITIPAHDPLKLGTLSAILSDVAEYLEISKSQLAKDLFG